MVRAIALLSGGLDSILAVKLIQKQNIEVTGLTFTTPFFGPEKALAAAKQISLPLIITDITKEHLQMLKSPRYGFGKNMNPCIDCHTLMLQMAGRQMEATGADFLLTGEVLGQRPMSQTKQSLYIVAKNSGYADYILRPLSARLLEPIKAERENKIDRGQLLSISGRGRKDQIRLAEAFGIHRYPPPAGGCLLTDPMFSRRLRELMTQGEDWQIRDFELLKYGRHFRVKTGEKIIVGRNKADNDALMSWVSEEDLLLRMANHPGPCVLIPYGTRATSTKEFAAELCVRYSDAPKDRDEDVICTSRGKTEILTCKAAAKEDCESLII